jgi:phage tail-like protein
MMLDDTQTALGVCYTVSLDDNDLGSFSSCDGLGIEVVMESHIEGGNNSFQWQFPSSLKFPNIKFTRPLGQDTQKVVNWFTSLTTGYSRCTGTIQAMTADGTVIATWSIFDVVPVKWTGPSLNADQPKVLTETLEIAHHGFLSTDTQF